MAPTLRLQMIMDAAGNATRFLKGVRGDADETSKALRGARERVNDLQRTARDVTAYKQMGDKLQSTRSELKAAQIEATRLAKAHGAAERPSRQLTRAFDLQRQKVRELKAAEQGHVHSLQTVRGRLDQAGISTQHLGRAEVGLARDLRRANAALDEQRTKLGQVREQQQKLKTARETYDRTQQFAGTAAGAGASSIAAGVAVGGPLVYAAKEAINFQDAMLDVSKVVDFDSPRQFDQMRLDIMGLSNTLPMVPQDIAAIVAAAGQAGIARQELIGFAKDAGQMGVAFDTTAEDAGLKMATWRTAFGMTQPEVRALADQINYLGDTGPANALKIADVVTRIGPLGEIAGLAAGEIAALGSTIVGMGVGEEVAATGIKNMMLALTKGTAATKKQQTAFSALGLDAVKLSKAMQDDAGGAIIDVLQRIRGLSEEKRTAILTDLFGSESVAAIAPALTKLEVLEGNLRKVGNASVYSGSMQREFENRVSGTKSSLTLMINALKNSAIMVGDRFLPIIKATADRVAAFGVRLQELIKRHPRLTMVVGALVGVLAGALLIFGGLALAVSAILGPFALLRFSLAMTAPMFMPLLLGLKGAAVATWGLTAALLANPITWVVAGVVALAAAAYLIYRNWGTISTWWTNFWSNASTLAGAALRGLVGLIMRFSPAGLLIRAFQAVWPALQSLGPQFRQFGAQMIMGLVNGLLGGIPALVRAVMGAGGRVITAFKDKLGIRSPSRVFAALGDDTMAGLSRGVARSANGPLAAISRVGAGMAAALALAPAAPAVALDSGPRIVGRAAPALAASQRPSIGSVTIKIVAAPGQSAEEIAREVARILQSPNLSTFEDDDEGFD